MRIILSPLIILLSIISVNTATSQVYDFENEIIEKGQLQVRSLIKPVKYYVELFEYGENYGEVDSIGTITKFTFFNENGDKIYEEYLDNFGYTLISSTWNYDPANLLNSITVVDNQNLFITFYNYMYNADDQMIKYFYFQYSLDGEYYYDVYKLYDEEGKVVKETFVKDNELITEQSFFYNEHGILDEVFTVNSVRDTISRTVYDYSHPGNIVKEILFSKNKITNVNELVYEDTLLVKLVQKDRARQPIAEYEFKYDDNKNLISVYEKNYAGLKTIEREYRYEYARNNLLLREYFFINGSPVYYLKYNYSFRD